MNNDADIIGVKSVSDLQDEIYKLHKENGGEIAIYPGVVSLEENPIDISSKFRKFLSSLGFLDKKNAKPTHQVLEDGFNEPIGELVELGRGKEYNLDDITRPSEYKTPLKQKLPKNVANAYLVMNSTYENNNQFEQFIKENIGSVIPTKTYKEKVLGLCLLVDNK
ncbi:MAG: hypothetical protein ACMXX8_02630 [Candidatus Woesearchaeota archaeon]